MNNYLDPRVLIVGPSRCGKDHAGMYYEQTTNWKYGGSTSKFLCKYVAKKLDIDEKTCYNDRHKNNMVWFNVGNDLRDTNPCLLLDEAFAEGNVAAGIRAYKELEHACIEQKTDAIIWVENTNRVLSDPTLQFTINDCINLTEKHGILMYIAFNDDTPNYGEWLTGIHRQILDDVTNPACNS